jgi:pSer/pThr/pTyr-binding forkhead associated (FHA) protein
MAAKLILSMDGLVLKEIPLTKERTTIGRKPHNDIQIDNLAISGEHSVIVTILNDSFLEDLNSTNGTYVNGQPIKKHFLQNSDVIELGKYKLKYINEAPSQTTAADFEKTMVLRPDLMKKTAEQAAAKAVLPTDTQVGMKAIDTHTGIAPPPQPAQAPAPTAGAAIQILTGSNAGKELELTKNLTTLGKPGVQVAVITRRPHGYFITHVEGPNFPIVNGVALDAHPSELKDHDVIEIAGVKMEFFLKS